MRLRGVLFGVLAIWCVIASVSFRNCGRSAPTYKQHTDEPSLMSPNDSEASQAYWLASRQVCILCSRATISREELQRKAEAIKSLDDGKRVWAELAADYSRTANVHVEGVKELESLPRDRIDTIAVECVSELVRFLTLRVNLFRRCTSECSEMAALFTNILAEGEAFDWDSPKGKQYNRLENELNARMKQTIVNEGSAEKRQLAELAKKANSAATELKQKHGRQFPDLLGN